MGGTFLWITEKEVAGAVSMSGAIAALERGLRIEAQGKARNMVKTHVNFGGHGNLHAIGAAFDESELSPAVVGTKTWAHTPGGAMPVLVMIDGANGALIAVIEAFALGQLRTGGISGVATKWLSSPEADELAVIGAGKQALPQVAAVACVRKLKRVRVFSPTAEKREAFGGILRKRFPGTEVVVAGSVAEAVKGAPAVTLVTRATEPFLGARMLAAGTHVNAVGAITPERAEFHQDLFPRAHRMAADSVDQMKKLSREFQDHFGEDATGWKSLESLASVVASGKGRSPGDDLSLFKAMGVGISDLSIGIEVLRAAHAGKFGRELPLPQRAEIRFD
ncbi:MAG: ornithine cyclodeaminase family protein [Deltaproteobacteria bacterium]|nr:ornithine cyclodeaminase family protein [Deltaproteobacteria bacterium]